MRGKGINYDTGFSPGGVSSREQFDAGIVRREMQVIADDLHCTAVRISGGAPKPALLHDDDLVLRGRSTEARVELVIEPQQPA